MFWREDDENIVKQSKKPVEKVLSCIVARSDFSFVTELEILEECGAAAEQYDHELRCVEKKVSLLHKREPCEVNRWPYGTVTFKLLKSNKTSIHQRPICSAYIPYIIFMQTWTYNEWINEKAIKEGLW